MAMFSAWGLSLRFNFVLRLVSSLPRPANRMSFDTVCEPFVEEIAALECLSIYVFGQVENGCQ